MKVFKTERIILFNSKLLPKEEEIIPKIESKESEMKILSEAKPASSFNLKNNFLGKKIRHFIVAKPGENQKKINLKEGRWDPEEQSLFIQGIVKFGIKWKSISSLIDTRTPNQIRSHAQKVFKKLKKRKDEKLGIDFTSKSITSFNDMIKHIKSVNSDYNLGNIFLYMINKCEPDNQNNYLDEIFINKNKKNLINEDLDKLNINNDVYRNNNINNKNILDIKENIMNNSTNINNANNINYHINTNINNSINNLPMNDLLITNQNLINNIYNQLNLLIDDCIQKTIATNIINTANSNIFNYFLNYYNNIYKNIIQDNSKNNSIPLSNQTSNATVSSINNN